MIENDDTIDTIIIILQEQLIMFIQGQIIPDLTILLGKKKNQDVT